MFFFSFYSSQQQVTLKTTLFLVSCFLTWVPVTSEGDLLKVEVKWHKNKDNDYELQGSGNTVELALVGKDNVTEKVWVELKPGLFSKDFKVSKCGKAGCKEEPLAAEEEKQATRCMFTGRLDSDPNSTVHISGCPFEENMDISVMSEKSNLKYNTYRVDPAGNIKVDKNSTFSDELVEAEEVEVDLEVVEEDHDASVGEEKDASVGEENVATVGEENAGNGTDYSHDIDKELQAASESQGKLSVLLHGQIYSYMYKTPRRGQKGPCCRLTRQKCYEDKWKRKICDTKWGRTRCGKGCTKLVETLERTAKWKERQKKNLEKIKEEKRMKKIRNMVMNMIQSTTKVRKTSTNPLCKDTRNTLRQCQKECKCGQSSRSCKWCVKRCRNQNLFTFSRCGDDICRKMQPIPKQKIYKEKTIEVGIYIDLHLYKAMEKVLKTSDEVKVKARFLRMIQSLLHQVETFLMSPTFSSKGGFRIKINGVTIYQAYGSLEEEWDSQRFMSQMLRKFQTFANKVNSQCDGDRDSYDAMILLTGRFDYHDVRPGGALGYAVTGQVCTIAPTITLTLRLDKEGNHGLVMARLLAHEFGHLLGSDHDGDEARNLYSIYKNVSMVPCPAGKSLMSPAVGMRMLTWSSCTRNMIDAEYDRREKKNQNCFFT